MARDNNSGLNSGMLGLIFGFVAGAATVLLSDPDNRQKVVKTANDLTTNAKDTVSGIAETVREGSKKLNDKVQSKVTQFEEAVDKKIEETENKEV